MDWQKLIRDVLQTGMTQREVAIAVGVGDSTISELLSGKLKDMYWARGDALLRLHATRTAKAA